MIRPSASARRCTARNSPDRVREGYRRTAARALAEDIQAANPANGRDETETPDGRDKTIQ